jgi:ABC-type branched-subunit amino acid transport system substrate-binding protein
MNTQALQQAIEQELKGTQDKVDSNLDMNESYYQLLTGRIQAYEWVLDQMKQLNENK